jgi:hypothetical protein
MTLTNLFAFAGVAFAMVITPGPNMAYLVSRSICQGRAAVEPIPAAKIRFHFVAFLPACSFRMHAREHSCQSA